MEAHRNLANFVTNPCKGLMPKTKNNRNSGSPGKKILICEDSPLAMKTLAIVLSREGFEPLIAPDGNEAINLLERNNFDLLVVDIHLPYHSGLELIKYLRSNQGKDTPVLVLTAFSDPQIQRQAHELGISGYITKPFNPMDLVGMIRTVLSS